MPGKRVFEISSSTATEILTAQNIHKGDEGCQFTDADVDDRFSMMQQSMTASLQGMAVGATLDEMLSAQVVPSSISSSSASSSSQPAGLALPSHVDDDGVTGVLGQQFLGLPMQLEAPAPPPKAKQGETGSTTSTPTAAAKKKPKSGAMIPDAKAKSGAQC